MKRQWTDSELADRWTLTHDEFELLNHRAARSRLAFSAMLKFFEIEGRFPREQGEVPQVALSYLGEQLDVPAEMFGSYDLNGRTAKRDREMIRNYLEFHRITAEESKTLTEWLRTSVYTVDHKPDHVPCSDSTHLRSREPLRLLRTGHEQTIAYRVRGIGGIMTERVLAAISFC